MPDITPLSPRQTFGDNMRPAHLLLRVYQLLASDDKIASDGDLVNQVRAIVKATTGEELLLINHELFLGLVRERADVKRSDLLERSLSHLLRQAVVTSCTALETYLPALLRVNLPAVIRVRGRNFLPANDQDIKNYFKDLSFGLEEVLRLANDPEAPERIATKLLGFINYSYLSSKKGIHLAGALLGIEKPWGAIAAHLGKETKELTETLEKTVDRRNDIVHRADRSKDEPNNVEPQTISYVRTSDMVHTVNHVCLALDDLVTKHITEIAATPDSEAVAVETHL